MAFENLTEQLAALNPQLASYLQGQPWLVFLFGLQIVMKLVFYPIALYISAKQKQKLWFVVLFICLLFLNDFGIFAILYIIFNKYALRNKQISKSPKKKR